MKALLRQLPFLKGLLADRERIRAEKNRLQAELTHLRQFTQGGHFYSPIPSMEEVRLRETELFAVPESLPGIALNEADQRSLLSQIQRYAEAQPFPETKKEDFRYYLDNPYFAYADGIFLYSLLRHFTPRRVIEVGSGFSSRVLLDVNERFFHGAMNSTFIEPFPERLFSLVKPGEIARLDVRRQPVQSVDLSLFSELQSNDILLIDSSHVGKIGSDINHLLFRVLPLLSEGVLVHFHDIYYPFEYPRHWIYEGRAWNEAYLLRAFLQYNPVFQIIFFNTYLSHAGLFGPLPLCQKSPGSGLWLRKTSGGNPV
ncbi:MAG: class I SAM-dependent methyltransferase [Fibrobacterota bacterium]